MFPSEGHWYLGECHWIWATMQPRSNTPLLVITPD
jgi:hypothetical protein